MSDKNLKDMKYSELQKLAKSCGIKANMKIEKLIKALDEYYSKDKNHTTLFNTSSSSCSTNPTSSTEQEESEKENSPVSKRRRKTKRGKGKKGETETDTRENEKKSDNPVSKGRRTRKTRNTDQVEQVKGNLKDQITSPVGLKKKPLPSTPGMKSPFLSLKSPIPARILPGTPGIRKSTPSSLKSPIPARILPGTPGTRKSTPSSLKSRRALPSVPANRKSSVSGRKSADIKEPTKAQKRKRSGSETRKSSTEDDRSEEPISKCRRSSSTSSAKTTPQPSTSGKSTPKQNSPGVKSLIKAMDGLSSDEMKASLLKALDKKVKENPKKRESADNTSSSGIPRFTAFMAKKNEEKKSGGSTPDWKKIHKKEFSRWDSIDVYMEKKRKRAECLTGSLYKAQKLLEETQSAVNKLKNTKTPQITKPIKPDGTRSSFQSPKVFRPSAISTQNLNLKFGSKKTPQKSTPKPTASKTITPNPTASKTITPTPTASKTITPTASKTITPKPNTVTRPTKTITPKTRATPISNMKGQSKVLNSRTSLKPTTTPTVNKRQSKPFSSTRIKSTSIRRPTRPVSPGKVTSEDRLNISSIQSSVHKRKSFGEGLGKGATPYNFSGVLNTSAIMNSSMKKPSFDLRASLSKPLSWKPHKGKLKPMDLNTSSYKHIGVDKASYKTPQTKTIEHRRQAAADSRADKKFKAQMNKRGIKS
ncbi:nucleolar and spindle-associated protein 1 [Patella vulgata]|uniref:nucleolar and spindle-associated protein 1 n=1 Tax=Patella vulgata TaxID=6465 RepID=UPI0021801D40|nr:nucleolar and spindle-associated protein 1 [Patella vulgata]